MRQNITEAINGGLYEKQKSITVNFAPVCRYNALSTLANGNALSYYIIAVTGGCFERTEI